MAHHVAHRARDLKFLAGTHSAGGGLRKSCNDRRGHSDHTRAMRVAVTGGSGQLGTYVLRRMLHDDAIESVVNVDVRPPLVAGNKIRTAIADVRDADLAQHFDGCDAVVHLAFIVLRNLPRAEMQSINVDGSCNVFEAAARANARAIVYTSSVAAYGVVPGHPVPIVEDTPRVHQRDFAYASTKYEVESRLDAFEKAHPGVAVTRLRPAILVGTRLDHSLGMLLKKRVLIEAEDTPPLPVVWDEDVADAVLLALKKKSRGAFNLSADEPATMREIATATGMRLWKLPTSAVEGMARLSPMLERWGLMESVDPAWIRAGSARITVSSERAKRDLGWKPRAPTSLDVMRMFHREAPRGTDARIAAFMRAADGVAPVPELRDVSGSVHLSIGGPGGGDYTLDVAEQRVSVRAGAPRPPSAVIFVRDTALLDLLAESRTESNGSLAGRVRIEGNPNAAKALDAVIDAFRRRTKLPGPRGWMPRALAGWFARGRESHGATR
jgi:nucleoside-diphosphate-sugar epimerase